MSAGLVKRATADDVKPVTGLQLKNLADATSDIKECDNIREALISRLEDESSPFVKQKVLRIIKYICQHGRADFRMELQRGDGNKLIKDCLQFKGVPHETRGDAPNQAVRDEAKSALAAIFGSGEQQTTSRENIIGFGSNAAATGPEPAAASSGSGGSGGGFGGYSAGTYGGNVSINVSKSGNMIGFGNPAFENQKESKSILDTLKEVVVGSGSSDAPFKPWQAAGPYQGAGAGYGPGQYPPTPDPGANRMYTPTINHSTQPTSSQAPAGGRKRGQVGGAWDAEPSASVPSRSAGGFQSPNVGSAGAGSFNDPYGAGTSTSAASSAPARVHTGGGEFERKVVAEIVQPSGVRSFPTPQEMSAFIKKVQSLDAYDIASLLDAKLAEDVPAASQLKALSVLEALLVSESAAEGVTEYYREHANDALLLKHELSNVPAIRKQTVSVLRKAGLRTDPGAAPVPTPQASQSQQSQATTSTASASAAPNLFDFPSDVSQAASTQSSFVDTPIAATTSLFGGLTVTPTAASTSAAAPAPAPAAANDLAAFFPTQQTAPQPVQQPQPVVRSEDPFTALLNMSKPAPAAAPVNGASASTDPFSALYNKKPTPTPLQTSNPYAGLTQSFAGSTTSSNAASNLNFLTNTPNAKNYNFTVTAAASSQPKPTTNGNGNSASIDPFANAFSGPVPKAAPSPAGASSNSSGFGFIASDKSNDPFGSLVQLK